MRVLAPFDSLADDGMVKLLATVGGALALTLFAWFTSAHKPVAPKGKKQGVHTLERRHFLLGDLQEMGENAERLHEWLYETSLRFKGEPWKFYLPGIMNTTVITTPELLEELLATQSDIFVRGQATRTITEDLMGKSFITTDGVHWFNQRKAVAKFFSARALRKCMQVHLRMNVGQLNAVLDRAAKDGASVDMMPLFQEFAMQTFSELALGIDLNVIGTGKTHVMERGIREGAPVIMRRGSLPAFWWKLERWLNVGPERKIKEGMQATRAWLNKVVPESLAAVAAKQQAQAQAGTESDADDVKSLVELFIENVDEDTDGLRAADLPEVILSLVIGARGTSATSLTWYFLLLNKHPEVERKLRDEMKASLENVNDDSYVSSDQLSKLVYLEATIKEMLRLYPALPLNQRVALADTVIGGSIQVKKGDNFFFPAYTTARLPTIWGPDAAEFKPERWIDPETGGLINYPTTKFQTFSTGARQCIGMRIAMLELRIAIVNILKRYSFTVAEPNDMSHILSTELLPAQPLVMKWTRNPLAPAA